MAEIYAWSQITGLSISEVILWGLGINIAIIVVAVAILKNWIR